jgi:predicted transcriptional regulator
MPTATEVRSRGDAVRQARVRAGHSVTALAALVGCSRAHLSNVERGIRAASPQLARALADQLGDWDQLFTAA